MKIRFEELRFYLDKYKKEIKEIEKELEKKDLEYWELEELKDKEVLKFIIKKKKGDKKWNLRF